MVDRVFILGAGFSKPAGMPLADELTDLLIMGNRTKESKAWIKSLSQQIAWLSGDNEIDSPKTPNIEQLFHIGQFDIEARRMLHQLSPVGREDGETSWSQSKTNSAWLNQIQERIRDVILKSQETCKIDSILRWAKHIGPSDAIITFNYDTLVEMALTEVNCRWHLGTGMPNNEGISVMKLHGSVDWIVAHRNDQLRKCDLLFDKKNFNRNKKSTGYEEDDCLLWRCRSIKQCKEYLANRHVEFLPDGASRKRSAIPGLGAIKPVHRVPGLGLIWANAFKALHSARAVVGIGFSLSEYDLMAQLMFAEAAILRHKANRHLPVTIIDPYGEGAAQSRWNRVFRNTRLKPLGHEQFDWNELD